MKGVFASLIFVKVDKKTKFYYPPMLTDAYDGEGRVGLTYTVHV